MAKIKKEDSEEIQRPTEDIKVDKPKFKSTLESMVKKKTPDLSKQKKNQ